ncbi:MAG: hypothetical protein ABI968_11805 [Acidobacteriota bacterium]
MAVSELVRAPLILAARRAYEWGRLQGALWRGAGAALVATPSFLACNHGSWAAVCLAGFALVVAAGRMRGEGYEDGTRAGAFAGILPCLLPAAIQVIDPGLCVLLSERGPWICGIGGVAAGIILGLRACRANGVPFWAGALAALAFPASLGCLPAGAIGFLGLAIGLIAGGVPALASRRALVS